ncbi:MAG: hypothetical protein MHM6MM_000775 [Cercozoa sp. M6MM]
MGICTSRNSVDEADVQPSTSGTEANPRTEKTLTETPATLIEEEAQNPVSTHGVLQIVVSKQKSLFRQGSLVRNLKKLLTTFKANISKNDDYPEDDTVEPIPVDISLEEILANSVLHEAFARFTLAKLAEESLLFVNDVSQYRAHSSKRLLNFIADDYVRQQSPFEVNVSATVRQYTENKIEQALDNTPKLDVVGEEYKGVFNRADHEIRELLMTNFVTGFVEHFNNTIEQGCQSCKVCNGKHRVVVIGAGPGGIAVAASLRNHPQVHLTLINDKEYFEDVPSMVIASCADYKYHEKVSIPLHDVFGDDSKNVRLVFGSVRAVRSGHVMVGTEQVFYDTLVLATGANYDGDMRSAIGRSLQLRRKQLKKQNQRYQIAKKVVVVGGGLVGCEMASEIADLPGDRTVTLLSSSCLLKRVSGAHDLALRELAALGIDVLHGDGYRIVDAAENSVTCANGDVFDFDAVVWAGGPRANSSYVSTFAPIASALTPLGAVKVDKSMRVLSDQGPLNQVFAVGDMVTVVDTESDKPDAPLGFEKNVTFALQVQNTGAPDYSIYVWILIFFVGSHCGCQKHRDSAVFAFYCKEV